MNRRIHLITMLLIPLLLIGCTTNEKIGNYDIAIVETTSNEEKSLVTYYDENLKK